MALIVQKFGGTSVNGELRIKACAAIVQKELQKGNRVIVVVSAMSGTTDSLLSQANSLGKCDDIKRELDSIVSAGEQISSGLMAITLNNLGIKAKSWLGWQVPIVTDGSHGDAVIKEIDTDNLFQDLDNGITPVVAGFQGVCGGNITTLGRGGSDTTAAAIAAATNADRCDLYTDVDGIYTADPHAVPNVQKLAYISYQELLAMADSGAKVVHKRCVEIAMKNKIPTQVLSSFHEDNGTVITEVDYKPITSITSSSSEVSLIELHQGVILSGLEEHIIYRDNNKILIAIENKKRLCQFLENNSINYKCHDNLSIVSVIGCKALLNDVVSDKILDIISKHDINIYMSFCLNLRASIIIDSLQTSKALVELHNALCLYENKGDF